MTQFVLFIASYTAYLSRISGPSACRPPEARSQAARPTEGAPVRVGRGSAAVDRGDPLGGGMEALRTGAS
jgi:hypothetical protein